MWMIWIIILTCATKLKTKVLDMASKYTSREVSAFINTADKFDPKILLFILL